MTSYRNCSETIMQVNSHSPKIFDQHSPSPRAATATAASKGTFDEMLKSAQAGGAAATQEPAAPSGDLSSARPTVSMPGSSAASGASKKSE
jgi:hypothetical protein